MRFAHYTASKHGAAGLTKSLALDLAPHGINVNMVAPALVGTEILRCAGAPHVPDDYFERLQAANGAWNRFDAQGAPIDAEEITQAVLWLASGASRFRHGGDHPRGLRRPRRVTACPRAAARPSAP